MHIHANHVLPSQILKHKLLQTEGAEKILRPFKHKHLPVNLLKASPTGIGLMSGRRPGLDLFRAAKLPLAINLETEEGALPDDRRLTKTLSEEHMDRGKGMPAASRRCWILRPKDLQLITLEMTAGLLGFCNQDQWISEQLEPRNYVGVGNLDAWKAKASRYCRCLELCLKECHKLFRTNLP